MWRWREEKSKRKEIVCVCVCVCVCEREISIVFIFLCLNYLVKNEQAILSSWGAGDERWGAGVETQKNVRGDIGGWGRVPFNETYAPSLSTIYDGA